MYPSVDIESKTSVLDRVFSPSTPITSQDFFCGRCSELSFIRESVKENGRHVLIYGDRGIGKSSLSNMISCELKSKVTCRKDSSFSSIFREAIQQVPSFSKIKFPSEQTISVFDVVSSIKKNLDKEKVLFILDEFDVIKDPLIISEFADAIKFFSDNIPQVCLVLVGVAKNAEELISFHRSLERCLLKIHLKPMSRSEMLDILDKGLLEISMKCEPFVREAIVRISSGYPYCVHLLSKYCFADAIQKRYSVITKANFLHATQVASIQIYESIKQIYLIASIGPEKSILLYKNILLCCAITSKDFFSSEDLLYSLRIFINTSISSRSCYSYLSKLCQPKRGAVLEKIKNNSRTFYRINDPFLKTYLTLLAYQKGYLNMEITTPRE